MLLNVFEIVHEALKPLDRLVVIGLLLTALLHQEAGEAKEAETSILALLKTFPFLLFPSVFNGARVCKRLFCAKLKFIGVVQPCRCVGKIRLKFRLLLRRYPLGSLRLLVVAGLPLVVLSQLQEHHFLLLLVCDLVRILAQLTQWFSEVLLPLFNY